MGMTGPQAIFGFPSHRRLLSFEGVTIDDGATGFTADARYSLQNAGRFPLSYVARATGTAVQFATYFGDFVPVGVSALVRHNLTGLARMRRRYYRDNALSHLLYDTGPIDVWPEQVPFEQSEWETNMWDGDEPGVDRRGYVWTRPNILPEVIEPAVCVTDIVDTGNPDGFIQFGLDEHAHGWQTSVNFDFDVEAGIASQTTFKRAWGGRKIASVKPSLRTWSGYIQYLPLDEYWCKAWELLRQYDTHYPFLFIPDPTRPHLWLRQAGMYTSQAPSPGRWLAPEDFGVPIKLEEAID